jgi:tyrosyl-tRNA synthetase
MAKEVKVINDEQLINRFLCRGVAALVPSEAALRQALTSDRRMRVYQGFDPTGPYLHVGHAIGIRALRLLQQLGHEVIFLVGDYTATIGDPDKATTRAMLTSEQVEKNLQGWQIQAGKLIDFSGNNPVKFMRNSEWLAKLGFSDILKLMSQTTIQRLLERDLFDRRLKAGDPIRFHELVYPLLQGYDSVAMEVDMEIAGYDQLFNMLVGRELVKNYLHKEKFIRANAMMDAPDGLTMSKTKGNGINLSDSANDMYGKAMSYPDSAIISGLELLTDVSDDDIAKIKKAIDSGENPMQFKKILAFEIVKTILGQVEAEQAEKYFIKVFSQRELPADMPVMALAGQTIVANDLVSQVAKVSKTEAKRLIEQGALAINNQLLKNVAQPINLSIDDTIKIGKKIFIKII